MARQKAISSVRAIDDIYNELENVARAISDDLPETERAAMQARLDGLGDSDARYPGADCGSIFFGALVEYSWKSGPRAATHAQKVLDILADYDAGRPASEEDHAG
jgi:hypothetical protein